MGDLDLAPTPPVQNDGPIITTVTFENSTASTYSDPVMWGQPFGEGDIPNGQFPRIQSRDTQSHILSRWPADNSLKTALIVADIPDIAGSGNSGALNIVTSNANLPGGAVTLASMGADQVAETTFGTNIHTANRAAIEAGSPVQWYSGPLMSMWKWFVLDVDADDDQDACYWLTLFNTGRAQWHVGIENTRMRIGGGVIAVPSQRYRIRDKHYPRCQHRHLYHRCQSWLGKWRYGHDLRGE